MEMSSYLRKKSKKCYNITFKNMLQNEKIPPENAAEWCLHHVNPAMKYFDQTRYAQWLPEDVVSF